MNKFIIKACYSLLCLSFSITLMAQDGATASHEVSITIPEVAILDIEPESNSISLAPNKPSEAGLALDFSEAKNTNLWLNYSSVVGSKTDESRTIDVKVSEDIPAGLLLKVTAAADKGTGDGVMGEALGTITLTTTAQKFIGGIGSCYTGSPEDNGHQLTYALELNTEEGSYGKIDFDDSKSVKVIYTITE